MKRVKRYLFLSWLSFFFESVLVRSELLCLSLLFLFRAESLAKFCFDVKLCCTIFLLLCAFSVSHFHSGGERCFCDFFFRNSFSAENIWTPPVCKRYRSSWAIAVAGADGDLCLLRTPCGIHVHGTSMIFVCQINKDCGNTVHVCWH